MTLRILYGPRDLIKSIYTVVGGSGVGAALIAYFAVTTFSTGDLFLLSITRVCRLHWSVRRGSWSRVVFMMRVQSQKTLSWYKNLGESRTEYF